MGHDSSDQHADDIGLSEDLEVSDGDVADGVRGGVKLTPAQLEAAAIGAKENTGLLIKKL
jgi:hypothetical protein